MLEITANQVTKLRTKNWVETNVDAKAGDNPINVDKEVVFITWAPFTDCISEINNTQIDNAEDIDVVMAMYNLVEYSDNYLKISGSYDNITEMKQLLLMLILFPIFLLLVRVLPLNLNKINRQNSSWW